MKYSEVKCPNCSHVFDPRTQCCKCGNRWFIKNPDNPPKYCPKCHSPTWDEKNSLRRNVSKKIEEDVDERYRRVFIQPKQKYYPDEIGCQICKEDKTYLHRANVFTERGLVITLLCTTCRMMCTTGDPNESDKRYLGLRGISNKEMFDDLKESVKSLEDLKREYVMKFPDAGVDVSLW